MYTLDEHATHLRKALSVDESDLQFAIRPAGGSVAATARQQPGKGGNVTGQMN